MDLVVTSIEDLAGQVNSTLNGRGAVDSLEWLLTNEFLERWIETALQNVELANATRAVRTDSSPNKLARWCDLVGFPFSDQARDQIRGYDAKVSQERDQSTPPVDLPREPNSGSDPSAQLVSAESRPTPTANVHDRKSPAPAVGNGLAGTSLLVIAAIAVIVVVMVLTANKQSDTSTESAHQPIMEQTSAEAVRSRTGGSQEAQIGVPDVPALLANETPPGDMPNYFDPNELGSAAAMLVTACGELTRKSRADIRDEMRARFCLCYADATRLNFRNRRSTTVTRDQDATCVRFSRTSGQTTPFGDSLPSPTAGIVAALMECLEEVPSDTSPRYGSRVCACTIDAITKKKTATQNDIDRCAIAARYAEAKGVNLTVRQFDAL